MKCKIYYWLVNIWNLYEYRKIYIFTIDGNGYNAFKIIFFCSHFFHHYSSLNEASRKFLPFILQLFFLNFYLTFPADPCYYHQSLSDANRKSSYVTPQYQEVCDDQLLAGWYRFVGAAGTKMPTTRVPAYRCGTDWSGWLNGAHPTVKDGEVKRMVCFNDRFPGCERSAYIFVKNCGSYFIYKLQRPPGCPLRYCSTDWIMKQIYSA